MAQPPRQVLETRFPHVYRRANTIQIGGPGPATQSYQGLFAPLFRRENTGQSEVPSLEIQSYYDRAHGHLEGPILAMQSYHNQVRGMERIPIFPQRQPTRGLRMSSGGHGNAKQSREVFNEGFYELFPWARGVDPFDESRTEWELAYWYILNDIQLGHGLEPDENAEVPPADAFINSLISLELDDLDKDDRSCAICLQAYRQGDSEEIPLELPCKHVFGKDCLLSWLTDIGNDGAHAACCPICRKECVNEKRKHIGTYEGLKQFLRDTNYVLTGMRGLSLMQEGREAWEDVKKYVNEYLEVIEEAKRERLQGFMNDLRQGLEDYPVTVMPTSVNAIGRDVVTLRTSMSQLLDELERGGVIASYLDQAEETFDEHEAVATAINIKNLIPRALLEYMNEVYAERYNVELDFGEYRDDEDIIDEDEGEDTSNEEERADVDGHEGIDPLEPNCDDFTTLTTTGARRYSWLGSNETQHWTWQGGEDSSMEDVKTNDEDVDLPANSEDERSVRLLGRIVQDTYIAVMRHPRLRRVR